MSAFTIPSIFTAVDKLTAPVRRMTGSVQSFAQKSEAGLSRLNRRLNRLVPSFGQLGKQMIAFAGTAALIGGLNSAITTVKDFEQANANLASIMSSSTSKELDSLGKDAERLGSITAKSATEVVGLQTSFARLGFVPKEIENMTEATISGSIAMNSELADTAELVGAVVNSFNNLGSSDSTEIIDQMTLATQKSALNFEKLQTSLPIVAKAADAAGVPYTKLVSLLGKLSDSGIDASSSSTALRNIFLESAKQGLSYESILDKIVNSQDQLTAANDEFGKRAAVSGIVLAQNIKGVDELDKVLRSAAKGQELSGAATDAANKQLDTTTGALTLLSSAWQGLVIRINEGSGAMGVFRSVIEFVTRNLDTIAITVGVLVGAFLALKTIVLLGRGALIAYNLIANAVFLVNMIKYVAATQGLTFAQAALTIAQTSLNAVMAANPIGLMIIAIVAVIAAVVLVITYWDEWGASIMALASIVGSFFLKFLGPIGLAISFVVSLYKNWQMVSDAFTNGGFIDGLFAIGKVILDVLLAPIQQLLELLSHIPGLDIAGDFAKDIEGFRSDLGLQTDMNANFNENTPSPLINNQQESAFSLQKIMGTQTNNVNLNVNDPNNRTTVDTRNAPGVKVGGTVGAI